MESGFGRNSVDKVLCPAFAAFGGGDSCLRLGPGLGRESMPELPASQQESSLEESAKYQYCVMWMVSVLSGRERCSRE
jgi:hypothetical protein